jgi:hypothetical protein
MTEDQAEEIYMAWQVGMFYGTPGELATAILILRTRELKEKESELTP